MKGKLTIVFNWNWGHLIMTTKTLTIDLSSITMQLHQEDRVLGRMHLCGGARGRTESQLLVFCSGVKRRGPK